MEEIKMVEEVVEKKKEEDKATKYWLFMKEIGLDAGMTLEEFKKSGFCDGLED